MHCVVTLLMSFWTFCPVCTRPLVALGLHLHTPVSEYALHCSQVGLRVLQEHWFTIRRVYGDFWNFNSLFPAPQPLSQFYLSAFLATLREQGYTIFVVKGPLSQQQNEDAGQPDSHGAWFTPEQVRLPKQAEAGLSVPLENQ